MRPVEWSQASGKHFSMCEESLIPGAEDGFAICVYGPKKITASWHQQGAPTEMLCISNLFKSLLEKGHLLGETAWSRYVFCMLSSFASKTVDDACKLDRLWPLFFEKFR